MSKNDYRIVIAYLISAGCCWVWVFFFNWYFFYSVFHLYVWRNGSFGHAGMDVSSTSLNVVETSVER